MAEKLKHGTKEYWMDWYWNRGGREKVQAKRYIAEYNRQRRNRNEEKFSNTGRAGENQ